jgi:hypothetical protein
MMRRHGQPPARQGWRISVTAHSRVSRRLGIGLVAMILAVGVSATSGSAHPVAADPILHGSCLAATPVKQVIETAPALSIGMTTRPCDNNVIGWNYSSAYPSNCYAVYNGVILDVDGVCGYSGNLTTGFEYIIKITVKNYTPKYVAFAFALVADMPYELKPYFESTCTYVWPYLSKTYHVLGSPRGSCAPENSLPM